jgi:hypothetical protein
VVQRFNAGFWGGDDPRPVRTLGLLLIVGVSIVPTARCALVLSPPLKRWAIIECPSGTREP